MAEKLWVSARPNPCVGDLLSGWLANGNLLRMDDKAPGAQYVWKREPVFRALPYGTVYT